MIFGTVVVFWLAYLIPWFLNHRDQSTEVGPTIDFSDETVVLRPGVAGQAEAEELAAVSTALMRRSRKRELARVARRAARRRRVALVGLILSTVAAVVVAVLGLVPWWTPLIPAASVVACLALFRFDVIRVQRQLDAQWAEVELDDTEATIAIVLDVPVDEGPREESIELTSPDASGLSLWDPIPVTVTTYISKPLASRTVRTIDLSAPAPATPAVVVTAEGDSAPDSQEQRRASGE